jgi:hypothetical protein
MNEEGLVMTTRNDRAGGRGRRIGAGLAAMATALGLAWVAGPAAGQERPTYEVRDFGVAPSPAPIMSLLNQEPVQRELRVTDAQKEEQQAAIGRQQSEIRKKMQEVRRTTKDQEKIQSAIAATAADYRGAIRKVYRPEQWERLDQIQLQAQGPLAFDRPMIGPASAMWYAGPPLAERLKLSDDQVKRIRAIVEEGGKDISQAAGVPIPLDPKDKPKLEEIRKYVEGAEFRAAREKATQAGREALTAVTRRVEEILTDAQRQEYHKLLGAPFDVTSLNRGIPAERERQFEVMQVAQALGVGGGGGQRADPDFKTAVDRPAYAGATHPHVLFDEAHFNFHTAGGRYKPFAELITSDGYQVIPNGEKFTREVLKKGDILVIANALGAEGMGMPEASNPAFTDAECDAVRDWVREGGSLLLITDHAPMGAAAECLAKRFGVNMSKTATGDPQNSEEGPTSLVFSLQNHLLGDHPITRGRDDSERLKKIRTFTGTSLKGPEGSVPILKLADTAVEFSFDGGEQVSAKGRNQGLAMTFGKGRVVVMGEAAELSAQLAGLDHKMGMNVPGIDNRQLALNILHWLSGLLEPREPALKKAG